MMSFRINNKPILKGNRVEGPTNSRQTKTTENFNQIFQQHLEKNKELQFSKHAIQRLQERNINLSKEDISKIDNAIKTAAQKGIKETLIVMDNHAFIASVKNKTVITAAVDGQLRNNVFTNIDGAVIV